MTRRSLLALLLTGILLTSCGAPAAGQPTPDINMTIAAGAQTLAAALFQTQTALAPAATITPQPTVTSLPTTTALGLLTTPTTFVAQPIFIAASPTPTGTYYTATPLASSLAVGCNNLRVINSYASPDGNLEPGQDFTQSWQVENNGTCDWVYLYSLVFVSGDKMGEGASQRLSKVIPPGKWTTFSVLLHAPNNSGTYKASWRFSDSGGKVFGETLPVSVTVTKDPDPTSTSNAAQTALSIGQTVIAQAATQAAAATLTQAAINAVGTAFCKQTPAAVPPAPNPPCVP